MCSASCSGQNKQNKGFTLIELLITTALGMILMMAVSTMFFVTTLNSAKIEAHKRLKNTGEDIKRNSKELTISISPLLNRCN